MKDAADALRLPPQRIHVQDARLLRRLVAFLGDLLLLDLFVFAAFSPILLSAERQLLSAFRGGFSVAPGVYAAGVSMALIALAYFALFEYLLGQTPGMMLLSLHAENVTLGKALIRNSFLLPLFPFPLLWILEPIHLLWRKTRLLELLTGTRTVERIAW